LREDQQGDFLGSFAFEDRSYDYRVRGYGRPILITAGIFPKSNSYIWRYIYECLAGTYFVYSLDLEGLISEKKRYGTLHYAKLVESFIRSVIGTKVSIISGYQESMPVLKAAVDMPSLVRSVMILSPGGIDHLKVQRSIAKAVMDRYIRIPNDDLMSGPVDIGGFPKGFRRQRRFLPGGMSPLRVCEYVMQSLG